MIIPAYLPANGGGNREAIIQIHGAVVKNFVSVPLLIGLARTQAGVQRHPTEKGC
jgi:hypothetical protein